MWLFIGLRDRIGNVRAFVPIVPMLAQDPRL